MCFRFEYFPYQQHSFAFENIFYSSDIIFSTKAHIIKVFLFGQETTFCVIILPPQIVDDKYPNLSLFTNVHSKEKTKFVIFR